MNAKPSRHPAPVPIFIAEREAAVARQLRHALGRMGYWVCGCVDAAAAVLDAVRALRALRALRPDLVLMNVVLRDGQDGVAVAEQIGLELDIPVLFLTAYCDNVTVSRAVRARPYGYLTKPFQAPELHAQIELALHNGKLTRCLRDSEVWFSSTLRHMADGVVATDADNRVRFLNVTAEKLLGWTHAKAEGRDHPQFYRPELTRRMMERMRLSADLRVALECQQFELYYQPIMDLADGRPHGAEALLRWRHPELGLLGPDGFLPLAEEIGLCPAIGTWVMRQACAKAMRWQDSGLQVAVNVSPAQFKDGQLLATVRHSLDASGLPPGRLCVEITENLLLGDTGANRDTLARLRAAGVQVAIDDFGTGYSSLSYLTRFSPTELKIDRSLIEHLDQPSEHAAIVTAAVAMAHSLRLAMVTEGVESDQQRRFLAGLSCEMAQGHWFLPPCPAPDFRAWLAAATA